MDELVAEIRDKLTAAGGPFAVHREVVDGVSMLSYVSRFGDLRQVAQIMASHGDREALVFGDRRWSFTSLLDDANRVAAGLAERGVGPGDRVAVLAANCPEWVLTFLGTVTSGAILVGLNGWWSADEIHYGLDHCGASVLVIDQARLDRVADSLDHLGAVQRILLIDGDVDAATANLRAVGSDVEVEEFSALIEGEPAWSDAPIDESDPAVIFYTSGTTGRPKGAVSTHRSMIANLQNTAFAGVATQRWEIESGNAPAPGSDPAVPTSLLTSPLFHVAGCHSALVVGLTSGMRIVMLDRRFEPEAVLGLIERERVTVWSAVPTMIWRVTECPDRHRFDTTSVTRVAFGGSPSAEELQRRIAETFPAVRDTTNAYGLTESSSVATSLSGPDAVEKPDSVGRPMPVVEIAIRADDGSHAEPNVTGEVLIKGPILMAGYWNDPEATAAAIRDGWLHTGDVGFIDEEGFLFITDRKKDMIIRGGENVYCVEIENRLVEHPAVADAAVIGVPHPELGEEVVAVIEVVDGAEVSDDEVQRWVGETLAAFKVPREVRRWTGKLPRNASGKLLKGELRGEAGSRFAETF